MVLGNEGSMDCGGREFGLSNVRKVGGAGVG